MATFSPSPVCWLFTSEMDEMRLSASATLLSGRRPIESAETTLVTLLAARCALSARAWAPAAPSTLNAAMRMISPPSVTFCVTTAPAVTRALTGVFS